MKDMKIVKLPTDAKMVAIIGACGAGKTTIIKNDIIEKKKNNEAYNPLLVFPAYHHHELNSFKEAWIEVFEHTRDGFNFQEEAIVKEVFCEAIKEGRDIYLDEMPDCIKASLVADYINFHLTTKTASRLYITMQWVSDEACDSFLIQNILTFFDCILVGKIADLSSSLFLEREFGFNRNEMLYRLKFGEFIERKRSFNSDTQPQLLLDYNQHLKKGVKKSHLFSVFLVASFIFIIIVAIFGEYTRTSTINDTMNMMKLAKKSQEDAIRTLEELQKSQVTVPMNMIVPREWQAVMQKSFEAENQINKELLIALEPVNYYTHPMRVSDLQNHEPLIFGEEIQIFFMLEHLKLTQKKFEQKEGR